LPVFALTPAKPLRILIGPEASNAQNNIAAVSAEAVRQAGAVAAQYRRAFGGLSVRFLVGQSVRNPADSAEFLAD